MRIASYNVENLFERAVALKPNWSEGREALEAHARVNKILNKPAYTQGDKELILGLLDQLGVLESDGGGEVARLRQNRGKLLKRPRAGGVQVVAQGRADWIGWVELKTKPVDELATRHTAMVLHDVGADIVGVIEAENRIALKRFTDPVLATGSAPTYPHVMVIDGNDDRGIDVGILSKRNYPLGRLRSHVDDADNKGRIFSRDCPEYEVTTPSDEHLVVLANHLKSKGYGTKKDSDALRRRQARRIVSIYKRLVAEGARNVVVLGDFNDTPDSAPLAPLLQHTDLQDISTHPLFDDGGRPGTFKNGTAANKIDYILLSPALYHRVTGGGIFRKGVWGGKNGTLFPHYETMTTDVQAASDHAAIYADIAV